MTLEPAMRYRQLEQRWIEHGGQRPSAMYQAQDLSGYIDWVDEKVQAAIDEHMVKRGLDGLDVDVSYDSEGEWYHAWPNGNILASEIVDPTFLRDVTAKLGVHRYWIDTKHRRLGVREPIRDLALRVECGYVEVEVVVGDNNETDSAPPNAGLVSTVRCYFDYLSESLCELGIEVFYNNIDDWMKDEDLWFLVDGTPCEPGESMVYVPECPGQLKILEDAR